MVASSWANVSRLIVSIDWLKDEDHEIKQPRYCTKQRVDSKLTRVTYLSGSQEAGERRKLESLLPMTNDN